MELIMRNGIIQSVLCLIGIHGPASCLGQLNWKNRKVGETTGTGTNHIIWHFIIFLFQHVHHNSTQKLGKIITTGQDLEYFAISLSNERNFVKSLDTILIPRTVGSEGHRKVREVCCFGVYC